MNSIAKDLMPEVLDDCESLMHESNGREAQFDPLLRGDETCANPGVLACWLAGCTVFVVHDQLSLRVVPASHGDGTLGVVLFLDSLL